MHGRTNGSTSSRLHIFSAIIALGAAWCLCPYAAFAAQPSETAAIFMYHHVSPTVLPGPYARDLTVTPGEFRAQLAWLQARGCRVVSVDALYGDVQRHEAAACEAALTFDDGYDDASQFVYPLLREFGYSGAFYIATGYVGTPGHVTVAQLRTLRAAGMEIGAHTVHHLDLITLPRGRAKREIDASAASLRRWLNANVTSFAYPAGQFNAQVVGAVRGGAFDNAVTTLPGEVVAHSNRYELPRYRIERGSGLQLMKTVFSQPHAAAGVSTELVNTARKRIAGNDPGVAEGVAVALLARRFPEQILKVHVLSLRPATVAGIVLSGVKFHRDVSREHFLADVAAMVRLAFDASRAIDEVDVWAIVPRGVQSGATVTGDYAVPTSKTVFSAAVTRKQLHASGAIDLGTIYFDPHFLAPAR